MANKIHTPLTISDDNVPAILRVCGDEKDPNWQHVPYRDRVKHLRERFWIKQLGATKRWKNRQLINAGGWTELHISDLGRKLDDPGDAFYWLFLSTNRYSIHHPTYGYRRITQVLRRQGYTVGTRRVARLMKDNNLLVSIKRAGQTTKSLQGEKPWSNLLEDLEVSHPDQVWVADITYIRFKGRFLYLSLLMDVFTRMIRAWQLSQHLNQSLTLKPLKEALCRSVPEIHHSDQGVQYLSNAYVTTLQDHGVEISVAHRGRPWENGYAERLIRTLKEEEIDSNDYQSLTEARDRIGQFIKYEYHQKRPHSALRYLTPFEKQKLS